MYIVDFFRIDCLYPLICSVNTNQKVHVSVGFCTQSEQSVESIVVKIEVSDFIHCVLYSHDDFLLWMGVPDTGVSSE